MGLEAGIRAFRLRYGPGGWGEGGRGAEEEKEEEKISHMCESIGHRTLRGHCPKRGIRIMFARPCPPVPNNIVTQRYLFGLATPLCEELKAEFASGLGAGSELWVKLGVRLGSRGYQD